jgi:hypothetical protein
MRTSKDFTLHFRVANSDYGIITVPKGTKLTNVTAMGVDKNTFFVDEFGWVPPHECGTPQHGLIMDAQAYGIRVPKEFVDFGTQEGGSK